MKNNQLKLAIKALKLTVERAEKGQEVKQIDEKLAKNGLTVTVNRAKRS